jgi:pimeloyl-ACP methyl ester carboxylesterase
MPILVLVFCVVILIFILIIMLFRIYNAHKSKINTPNGIQEKIYVKIGGIEQYFQIRGEDKNNPIILWIHGGPGFPLTYLTYYYQTALEKNYTVVTFEQRGCSRTFYRNKINNSPTSLPVEKLTVEKLLADMNEIVDYLCQRFGKEKIIIIGQSWGTILGTKYVNIHPEKVFAYIGIGQVTNFAEMKIYMAEKALKTAMLRGNIKDCEILKSCIKQFSETENIKNLNIKSLEKMVILTAKYFKCGGKMSGIKQIWTAVISPEMSWKDMKWFLFASKTQNIITSQNNLIDYLYFGFDIMNLSGKFDVPIYFIQGENDFITPTDLVQKYYSNVSTVKKEIVVIENSGHTPFFDNPKQFCESVKAFLGKL